MSGSIFEVEHRPNEEVVLRFKAPRFWGLSEPTKQHVLAAQKEMLLALRSLLDRAIEKTEEVEKTKRKTKTRIKVQ